MVRRDGGSGVVPQQVGQLGVGAPFPQDHVPPVRQLVQDKVPAAIPAPGERGDGGRHSGWEGNPARRSLGHGRGGPSPVGQDEADGALAEADQEAARGLILQQLLRLPAGKGPRAACPYLLRGIQGSSSLFRSPGVGMLKGPPRPSPRLSPPAHLRLMKPWNQAGSLPSAPSLLAWVCSNHSFVRARRATSSGRGSPSARDQPGGDGQEPGGTWREGESGRGLG